MNKLLGLLSFLFVFVSCWKKIERASLFLTSYLFVTLFILCATSHAQLVRHVATIDELEITDGCVLNDFHIIAGTLTTLFRLFCLRT